MKSLLDALKTKKILVSDGAWGTFLQARGLQPGECPELWNATHRNDVFAIAKSYIDAGADMILTNSFGGSPIKLEHFGLRGRTSELNKAAAAISREAAGENHFVLGSMGPTGVMLMMGEVAEQELYDGFSIQAQALKDGGVDALCVETMSALDEAYIAVRAAREATGLEIVCTFTFEKTVQGEFRTMMGVTPSEIVQALKDAGASIIGSNCGNGFAQMISIVKELRSVDSSIPILVHANAGKPFVQDGKTCFPETAEMMAAQIPELLASGANIIGGCCGTTPAHIKALVGAIRNF
ncbi:MAG TPA: homocysteine S-methyltransferase family protein [Bacteroidota bacterium]|nr:homocysteine S-methyltransferase family protein [Bacteroidota bacterium]